MLDKCAVSFALKPGSCNTVARVVPMLVNHEPPFLPFSPHGQLHDGEKSDTREAFLFFKVTSLR